MVDNLRMKKFETASSNDLNTVMNCVGRCSARNCSNRQIHQELEDENTFPYFFDVVHGDELSHKSLIQHIQDHGSVVYPDTLTG